MDLLFDSKGVDAWTDHAGNPSAFELNADLILIDAFEEIEKLTREAKENKYRHEDANADEHRSERNPQSGFLFHAYVLSMEMHS